MKWKQKLLDQLEPDLAATDAASRLGRGHHDVSCAIFPYPAEQELAFREEMRLLVNRLSQTGKTVRVVSLAECLVEAIEEQGRDDFIDSEDGDPAKMLETLGQLVSSVDPLADLVRRKLPDVLDPARDVVFLVRAASLFKIHRASALMEQAKAFLTCPSILFYPGELEHPIGLRFLDRLPPDNSYRYKIY